MYIHIYVCVFMYVFMRSHMYACICMYVYIYIYMYVCIYIYIYIYICKHVCVYVFEMKQQSVAPNSNFPVNKTLSAYDITQITPGQSNSRHGQGQNRNSTGQISCAAICTDIFARPQCRKTQRCKIFIVFHIAGLLWCTRIVQYTVRREA
jgi:hypothetical protein